MDKKITETKFKDRIMTQWKSNRKEGGTKAPHIVCNRDPEKSGSARKAQIEMRLKITIDSYSSIINKKKWSCFTLFISYDIAVRLRKTKYLSVTPMFDRMKISRGTYEGDARLVVNLCKKDPSAMEKLKEKLKGEAIRSCEYKEEYREDYGEGCYVTSSPRDEFRSRFFIQKNESWDYDSALKLLSNLASSSSVCSVSSIPQATTFNSNSRWILQGSGGTRNNRINHLHDAGIRGRNQIAQVVDTGVDVLSCYFFDPENPNGVRRDNEGVSYAF